VPAVGVVGQADLEPVGALAVEHAHRDRIARRTAMFG
jgi:hypothetical protein